MDSLSLIPLAYIDEKSTLGAVSKMDVSVA
jgi:hypothetical protein